MEAATAADSTEASEIAVQYITLGSAAKGYVLDLTVLFSQLGRLAKRDSSKWSLWQAHQMKVPRSGSHGGTNLSSMAHPSQYFLPHVLDSLAS